MKAVRKEGWDWMVLSSEDVIEEERTANERYRVTKIGEFDVGTISDYCGLILISGAPIPTEKFYYDMTARHIVVEFNRLEKPIAGMCAMVPVMRYVLKGKRATAYPSNKVVNLLKQGEAIITEKSLEIDGRYITAQHEEAVDVMMDEFIRQVKELG